jgi:hypothetical protein
MPTHSCCVAEYRGFAGFGKMLTQLCVPGKVLEAVSER